jgi:hypothetical protein
MQAAATGLTCLASRASSAGCTDALGLGDFTDEMFENAACLGLLTVVNGEST